MTQAFDLTRSDLFLFSRELRPEKCSNCSERNITIFATTRTSCSMPANKSVFFLLLLLSLLARLLSSYAATLKEVASFPIGVAVRDNIASRPDDWQLLKTQFSYLTAENCMKPDPLQRQEGHFAWEVPDSFVSFSLSNNFKMVGHCLVWAKDDRTPPWFRLDGDQPASRELLLQRMKTHIDTVVGRYRGKIAMWDVVNEALDDGTNYLRASCWSKACGDEFIVKAF